MTVEPTKLNPRCLRSLLNASDSDEVAGICRMVFHRFSFGRPSTKRQQYESKLPNSSWILRNARALRTAASIFMRLRIIAESNASVSIRRAENRATFSGSNSSKARRYPSRFFSTIVQLNPACAPSSTRNSKCLVIVDWDTPFAIVILEHQRITDAGPGAPFNCCTAHKLKTVPLNVSLAINCYMYYDNMSRINNQFSVGVHIMTALGDHHC